MCLTKINEKYVQIDYKYLSVKYEVIGFHRGKATIATNIDMKLNLIPLAILELVAKAFCRDFLENVMECSRNFAGSKWEQKAKKHPASFDFFRSKIDKYYNDHNMK